MPPETKRLSRYLIESYEWRLLRELARLVSHRKAQYQTREWPIDDRESVSPRAELFEFELRHAFVVEEVSRNLSESEFAGCEEALRRLCSMLENLVPPQRARFRSPGRAYPGLHSLIGYLEETSGQVDLAHGPNETLFQLPHEPVDLDGCLRVVTEYNHVLGQLLESPAQEPVILPPRSRHKKKWKEDKLRDQVLSVLGSLFRHFKCGLPHEVLLSLDDDSDGYNLGLNVQLMLSQCPELELWHEVRCGAGLEQAGISIIPDICSDLQEHPAQGEALTLFVHTYALFGSWAFSTPCPAASSRQSLDELITEGVFKPRDVDILNNRTPLGLLTPRDKRKLAVQLGYYLMNFFDAGVTSRRIYFLISSESGLKTGLPHLAFGPELSTHTDSHRFRMGHPVLLSFAKLLLEIDCGEAIELVISPLGDENKDAWTELLDRVDCLSAERNDSYLKAVSNCLNVHRKIAKALGSRDTTGKSGTSKIRKTLYKEVVRKLEEALAESIPGRLGKRTRPTPSPLSDHEDGESGEEGQPRHKKRSVPLEARGRLGGLSKMALGESHDSGRSTPTGHAAKVLATLSFAEHPQPPSCRGDFAVAIICALPLEYDAVSHIFDEYWDDERYNYGKDPDDPNTYKMSRVGDHAVVLTLLRGAGKVNAAKAATSMRVSFRGLRLALLVGVCGGVPRVPDTPDADILLGDVVISSTVVQYDYGRQFPDKFVTKSTVTDSLGRPNDEVSNLVNTFNTVDGRDGLERRTAYFIRQIQKRSLYEGLDEYRYPGFEKDKLFEPAYRHKHHVSPTCLCSNCSSDADPVCDGALVSLCADLGCDDAHLVPRRLAWFRRHPRPHEGDVGRPTVHVGPVASGDKVMKSAAERDLISGETGAIAFEMEGAGMWDAVPTVVVKGVCDYADSHKHKGWQSFAAGSAAAAAKAMLERYV